MNRPTNIMALDFTTRQPCEIYEGDGLWGVQTGYYEGQPDRGRNAGGGVFWHTGANEWRMTDGTAAEFYAGLAGYQYVGWPISKMTNLLVFPDTGRAP